MDFFIILIDIITITTLSFIASCIAYVLTKPEHSNSRNYKVENKKAIVRIKIMFVVFTIVFNVISICYYLY